MPHRGSSWIHGQIHFLYTLPEEVKHFYELAAVKQILSTSIGVFLPVYILSQTGSLSLAVLYAALGWGIFPMFTGLLNVLLLKKIGVEKTLYIGILALVVESAGVVLLPLIPPTIIFLAFLEAVHMSTYWDAFHTAFGIFGKKREETTEVAGYSLVLAVIGIITPIVMGALITQLGYHQAYAIMLLVGVVMATYLVRHFTKKRTIRVSIHKVVNCPYKETWLFNGLALFPISMISLYVFTLSGNKPLLFGGYISLMVLISALLSLYVAHLVDKQRKYWLALIQVLGTSLILLSYAVTPRFEVVVLLEILRQIVGIFGIAIYGPLYEIGKRRPEILFGRSLYIRLGKGIAGLLAFALVLDFTQIFLLGAVFSLTYAVVLYRFISATLPRQRS